MKPILCAGLVCLDQVTVVSTFPLEDTDQRSVAQYKVGQVMSVRGDCSVSVPEPGR